MYAYHMTMKKHFILTLIYLLVSVLLVSCSQPVPTPTPTPMPTPTPTPAPTPMPNAQSIIDQSKIVMFNSASLKSDGTWVIESPSIKMTFTINEEYQGPDKHKLVMDFANEFSQVIQISDRCYESIDGLGETKWVEAECGEEVADRLGDLFSPEKITLLDLNIQSYTVVKDYEGSATYYINSGELEDFSQMSQTNQYELFFTDKGMDIEEPNSYEIEYWIDRDSHVLRKANVLYNIDSMSEPYDFWEVGDPLEIEVTTIFSSNHEIKEEIVAPGVDFEIPVATATPQPIATHPPLTPFPTNPSPIPTPDLAASSTPITICGNLSEPPMTSPDFYVAMMLADSFEIPVGSFYQTTGDGQSLPNSTCLHKYSFQAVKGVSYAISVYVHSEGLTMLNSWLELWDRHDNLIDFNVDYPGESLGSRIFFTAEYNGLYYFYAGEMDYSASNSTYRVQVFKEPSDRKLVFASDFTGTGELFLSALDDNSLMQLTDNGYATDDPRFELDQVSNYDSKEARSEIQPVFSPNGKVIAYVSNAKGNNDIYFDISFGINLSIFITSQSTSDPGNDSNPSWHPNGDYLAFTTNRNGKAEIYLVNLSNNLLDVEFLFPRTFHKYPLIQMSERHAYDPEYSLDGTLVAFTSRLVSGDELADIYIHNVATGENTNITNTDMTQIGQHDWSPDGSKLIFRADPDATDTYHPSQLEIFTINKDGSNLVQITNNEKLDASPKWSNDGTSIYFVSHENQEKPKIYVMDTDGSNVKRVTSFSSSMAEIYFDIYE